jgi:hypothetical protein
MSKSVDTVRELNASEIRPCCYDFTPDPDQTHADEEVVFCVCGWSELQHEIAS